MNLVDTSAILVNASVDDATILPNVPVDDAAILLNASSLENFFSGNSKFSSAFCYVYLHEKFGWFFQPRLHVFEWELFCSLLLFASHPQLNVPLDYPYYNPNFNDYPHNGYISV